MTLPIPQARAPTESGTSIWSPAFTLTDSMTPSLIQARPMEQGLATFSALQRQGVPSRFVHVPDENHWVLKPQTWVEWQQEILDWTADWTKEGQQTAP